MKCLPLTHFSGVFSINAKGQKKEKKMSREARAREGPVVFGGKLQSAAIYT